MDADFTSVMAAAEFALLRAALVSAFLRASADDEQILTMQTVVSRGDSGQFDIDVEFQGQAGFGVGGMSV